MSNEDKFIVKIGGEFKPYVLKVKDIFSCDEYKEFTNSKGEQSKIEFPYRIKIVEGKRTVSDEPTTATMFAKDWRKKFYKAETSSGNELVAYTRNHTLLAIIELMKKTKGLKLEKGESFNLKNIEGFEFEGFLVELKDKDPFIDWPSTFEHNGIEVPQLDDFLSEEQRAVRKTIKEMDAPTESKTEVIDAQDLDKMPWETGE